MHPQRHQVQVQQATLRVAAAIIALSRPPGKSYLRASPAHASAAALPDERPISIIIGPPNVTKSVTCSSVTFGSSLSLRSFHPIAYDFENAVMPPDRMTRLFRGSQRRPEGAAAEGYRGRSDSFQRGLQRLAGDAGIPHRLRYVALAKGLLHGAVCRTGLPERLIASRAEPCRHTHCSCRSRPVR